MKAIELTSPSNFNVVEKAELVLEKGKAIVKIHRIGICGTDYHAFKGNQPFFTYPRVLGHELGGEIVDIDESTSLLYDIKIGDKVSIEPYLNCGDCQACNSGHQNCCEKISVIGVHEDGGMSEYISLPANKVHVSKLLSYEQLALVETLGIGLHAVKRAKINTTDIVLIVGAGPIGLGVAKFAKLYGAKVCMADVSESRLAYAKSSELSDYSYLVDKQIDINDLKKTLEGRLPTAIFDATGNKNSMANTFNLVAHGGKIIFVGLFIGDLTFNDPNFHKREVTLMASRNSLPEDFKEIITAMENGEINAKIWLTHTLAFDKLPEEFNNLTKPETSVIKAIIEL